MTAPATFTPDPAIDWRAGDRVLWPNGIEGEVAAVDFDDMEVMNHGGAWVPMSEVDRLS